VTITLRGPIPCKKSLYRRGKSGGLFLDTKVKAAIDALILQAQWRWHSGPLEHPEITVTFQVLDRRSDRDGKLATVLDVLQKAGVILNDNIAHCNGRIVIEPAIVGDTEGSIIRISAVGGGE
jgi:hypothetical protein